MAGGIPEGYELDRVDEFDGPELDPTLWIPHHLPHWSSSARSAARFRVAAGRLELMVEHDQDPWCPEFDGQTRVSSLQTAVFSGRVGSTVGQHRFNPDAVVREEQPLRRLYTPRYGAFVLRARAEIDGDSMVAFWMIGVEETPEQSGEICVCEIFGSELTPGGALIGVGVHPFGDPDLTDDFTKAEVAVDVRSFHDYAAVWRPGEVAFLVDGSQVRTVAQAPDYPMQFMLGVYDFATPPRRADRPAPRFVVDSFRAYRPSPS